jgi:hypothetical protein
VTTQSNDGGTGIDGQLGQCSTANRGGGPIEMGDGLLALDLGANRTTREISTGCFHTCARLDDNSVKSWGNGFFDQLGQGSTGYIGDGAGEMGESLPAFDLGTGLSVREIAGGTSHTCSLLDDYSVKCWGRNYYGQHGQGSNECIGQGPGEMNENLPAINLGAGQAARRDFSWNCSHRCLA